MTSQDARSDVIELIMVEKLIKATMLMITEKILSCKFTASISDWPTPSWAYAQWSEVKYLGSSFQRLTRVAGSFSRSFHTITSELPNDGTSFFACCFLHVKHNLHPIIALHLDAQPLVGHGSLLQLRHCQPRAGWIRSGILVSDQEP